VPVSDGHVDFAQAWEGYDPPQFTVEASAKKSPDPSDVASIADWKSRPPSSHFFVLTPPPSLCPLNPFGRTGLRGRGKLYRWGPNHAADCILTRAGEGGERELLVIRRGDTGEWALPGGMIDEGETPEECIRREFGEEVMGVDDGSEGRKGTPTPSQEAVLSSLFAPSNVRVSYRGYVDDGRNTDNAWMETAAFSVEWPASLNRESAQSLFVGGSDARETRWIPVRAQSDPFDRLHGSHTQMVLHAMKQKIH
jgi:ADP-ribose pyrophosphatase